jgi:phenylacetate-CoA ligase
VHDLYSSQELGMMALECPDHPHYHVQSENVLIEVLDDDGRPCEPGRVGRLVATDLHNFAQPMIRYEMGDHAVVGEPCPCGRGLPVLERILGRTRNMVRRPGGGTFWPVIMFSDYAAAAPVRQMQLVQKSLTDVELRAVAVRPMTPDEEAEVTKLVQRDLGHAFNVTFDYVDAIERAANGKYEDFRSEVE